MSETMLAPRKRIAILFSDIGNEPIGGYKVMLQYANMLAEQGYDIHIFYSCYYSLKLNFIHAVFRKLKKVYFFLTHRTSFSCKKWFELNTGISEHLVWSLYTSEIIPSDFYFATAAVTANALNRFNVPASRKFYFVQSYETWQIGEKALIDTYKIDCTILVVSNWLKHIVDRYASSIYLPNGFDFEEFRLTKPIADRNPKMVSILYHELPAKGFEYGYKALCLVKKEIPNLTVLVFGVYDRPDYLPEWFHYYKRPDIRQHNWINNEAAIYLGTSVWEGYGLTIGEAMMCGQAVVCTDNDGYMEMAIPEVNAIVCQVRNPEAMSEAIIRVIKNKDLRERIAGMGYQTIRNYSIDRSFAKLRQLIEYSES